MLPNFNAVTTDLNLSDKYAFYFSIDRSHKSITLRGFTVEACRRYGINALDSYNVQLLDMEVRNTGERRYTYRNLP